MLKAVVVDDEYPARQLIILYLQEIGDIKIIGEFDNGQDAVDFIKHHSTDVVFLDIMMYQINGLDTAASLNNLSDSPSIIFTTGYMEYAVEAFELKAVDYLVKPYSKERIASAINKIRGKEDKSIYSLVSSDLLYKQGKLSVWTSDRLIILNYSDIIFFKAYQKGKSFVYVDNNEYITDLSLAEIESRININQFLRVHKSFIINTEKVLEIIPWISSTYVLKLEGSEEKIPVSRHFIKDFKEVMKISV